MSHRADVADRDAKGRIRGLAVTVTTSDGATREFEIEVGAGDMKGKRTPYARRRTALARLNRALCRQGVAVKPGYGLEECL